MRGDAVVVFDPSGQLTNDRLGIAQVCSAHVLSCDRVHEGFRHPIRLRTVGRRRDRCEVKDLAIFLLSVEATRTGMQPQTGRQASDVKGAAHRGLPVERYANGSSSQNLKEPIGR